jgi:ligand-binding sensor domain-containing protein
MTHVGLRKRITYQIFVFSSSWSMKTLWPLWFLYLLLGPVMAQSPGDLLRIYDHDIPVGDQASHGFTNVLNILQDKRGFMWFATAKGLIGYDGVHYEHFYRLQNQPRSLGGNYVSSLLETPDGSLYLTLADGGLSHYDRYAADSRTFTNFPHHPRQANSPSTNALYTVACDSAGILWMGGENSGLIRFDPRTRQFSTYRNQPGDPASLPDNTLFRIYPDPDGTLWMGTREHGLVQFDPRLNRFTTYSLQELIPASYESENGVGPICIGRDLHTVWFSSQALGLCALDKRTGQVRIHGVGNVIRQKSELTHFLSIVEDPTGLLWLGHTHQGVLLYDPLTGETTNLPLTSQPGPALEVHCIYFDRTGLAWLATNRGVIKYNPVANGRPVLHRSSLARMPWGRPEPFTRYPIRDASGQPLTGLLGIGQDKRGDCWLQLPDRLSRYDTSRRQVIASYPYPRELLKAGLKHIQVTGEEVFLLSFKGLYVLDKSLGRIIPLPLPGHQPGSEALRTADICDNITPDTLRAEPILWIGSWEKGLFRYWIKGQYADQVPIGPGQLPDRKVLRVYRDRKGTVWVGMDEMGLLRLDDKDQLRFTHWLNLPDDPHSLPDNLVFDLTEDRAGTLWLATGGRGIARVVQRKGKVAFETFGHFPDGPTPRVFQVRQDPSRLFWLSTAQGVYVFNASTDQIIKVQPSDALMTMRNNTQLNHSFDGSPLFYTDSHILRGHGTSQLYAPPADLPLQLTNFTLLKQPRNDLLWLNPKGVHLTYWQNQFGIGFSAPFFQHPERIRYRYRLEDFDRSWVEAGSQREASYTNLPSGQYTFVVQAGWDGARSYARTVRLPIEIVPAFWERWWFRTLAGLSLLLLLYGGYVYRIRDVRLRAVLAQTTAENSRQEAQLREREASFQRRLAEIEMTALRAQMNPHFIFNCLNSIKLYASDNDAAKASVYLTKFSRLIRLVLENSRCEKVTLANELEALKLYLDMEVMRFKDKLQYWIQVDPAIEADFVEIPPLLLQPYVENAIWHGLMHKPVGGTVQISLEQPDTDHLKIVITDDGIGRAKAAAFKSKSATLSKSFGMKVTSERIQLINQIFDTHTEARIVDLFNSRGEACGTEVVITIPL